MTPERWQAVLGSLAGLTEKDRAYADRLFWNDRPAWRPLAARDLYTCGLTARAALSEGGAEMGERLPRPYEGRNTVISDLVATARAFGAYRPVSLKNAAQPGRILIVGKNHDPTWGSPASEHVVCVHLAAEGPGGSVRLATVEGGQRDAQGVDSIQAFERLAWLASDGNVWLGTAGGLKGRRVGHVIDVSAWPDRR